MHLGLDAGEEGAEIGFDSEIMAAFFAEAPPDLRCDQSLLEGRISTRPFDPDIAGAKPIEQRIEGAELIVSPIEAAVIGEDKARPSPAYEAGRQAFGQVRCAILPGFPDHADSA